MKHNRVVKSLFAFALTIAVLFTVNVRETHYLFSEHHAVNEHCDNHLHGQEQHDDCSVCKFDVSLFTDEVFTPDNSLLVFGGKDVACIYQSPATNSAISFPSLRGPPVLA